MSLIDSVCTISLRPLGRIVTTGCKVEAGMASRCVALRAHDGRLAPVALEEPKDSLPPKPLEETGLPEGCGVRIAVID